MPKLKSHSGTKDRVKITPTGKMMRGRPGGTHNLSKKSGGRKRSISTAVTIDAGKLKVIRKALGV
jgi:large subunit ribosomal protein L35